MCKNKHVCYLIVCINILASICQGNITDAKIDDDLVEAINLATPQFAESLKRRFTNVGVSQLIRSTKPTEPFAKFDDIYFQDDNNQVTLKNIVVSEFPEARIKDIQPNLRENNLYIVTDWYNIIIVGEYDMSNTSQLTLLPVQNEGKFEIVIDTVTASGIVGYKIERYALKAINFNLQFSAKDCEIKVEYLDNNTKTSTISTQPKRNLDKTIAKYIKGDLYWKLQEALRTRLDHVLVDFSLTEMFNDNAEIAEKYIKHGNALDDFINKIVDKIILFMRERILAQGNSIMPIADFHRNFSHKFGLITYWGELNGTHGTLGNLSTIKKTAPFSLFSESSTGYVTLFGSLGLENMILKYDHYSAKIWHIGPSGDIKSTCDKNSINFKVTVYIDVLNSNFTIKDHSVKIVQLENIKVKATGLGFALNWLLSYIITWMTGLYKKDIIKIGEKILNSVFDK